MVASEQNLAAAQGYLLADFAAIAERLRQVSVEVRGKRRGGGSGIVWRGDGLIITNSHVVAGNSAEVRLADGRIYAAKVTKRDRRRDLAALHIEAGDLIPATVGDSDSLRVGELALAIGNPLGHIGALATGIIHAADRRWIEADVRLAPGNSGGLLANACGEVIGINTMIARGLALAVPVKAVEHFLLSEGRGERPSLGVHIRPIVVSLGEERTLGFLVLQVQERSAAERAGLLIGDILVGVGGRHFRGFDDLSYALGMAETLELDLIRGGSRINLRAALSLAGGAAQEV
ncbi:MAG: trypsin-like peptidase domain-containing protein [Acidobacteria bacterium]|nr:trypsin-like peptidase domain-containing protein [Acidobacteriota bacterium]